MGTSNVSTVPSSTNSHEDGIHSPQRTLFTPQSNHKSSANVWQIRSPIYNGLQSNSPNIMQQFHARQQQGYWSPSAGTAPFVNTSQMQVQMVQAYTNVLQQQIA